MFEIIFILVFVGILMISGITTVTFFVALGIALLVLLLISVISTAIKLLPWILLALIGLYVYKRYNQSDSL